MNRHEEIEARLSAIAGEIDADGADIDALTQEVRALKRRNGKSRRTRNGRPSCRKEVEAAAGRSSDALPAGAA